MLRVIVELIPGGYGDPKTLGEIQIWNDGTGTESEGNYGFTVSESREDAASITGEVKGFRRLECGPWKLVYRVLESAMAGGASGEGPGSSDGRMDQGESG